jgi:hypothetical protein
MPVGVSSSTFQRRAEPTPKQEVDPLDRVLQGLQIANSAFGIVSNLENIQTARQNRGLVEAKMKTEAAAAGAAQASEERSKQGKYTEPEYEKVLASQKFIEIKPPATEEEMPASVLRRTVIGPEGKERSILLRQAKPMEMEFKSTENQLTREERAEMVQKQMDFERQQKELDRLLKKQISVSNQDLRKDLQNSRENTQRMMFDLKREENPALQKRTTQAEGMSLVDQNLLDLTKRVDPQSRENLIQLKLPFGLKSQAWQDYETSALQFLDPIARTRTGAAMPKDEFHKYFQQYFPMPGDSSDMVEFKAKFRQLGIQEVLSGKKWSAPTPPGIEVPSVAPDASISPSKIKPSSGQNKPPVKTYKASDLKL